MKKSKSKSRAKTKDRPKDKTASKSKAKKQASQGKEGDIIRLILKDHLPLKKLIETLKDSDAKLSEKKTAHEKFVPLLLTHAKAEEESLYVHMKEEDAELRAQGFEGDTEHALAERLIEEIKNTRDQDEWTAKVKVLAELVEHHIEEEEGEMFKEVRKEFELEKRTEIGDEYTRLYAQHKIDLQDDSRSKNKRSNGETEKFI